MCADFFFSNRIQCFISENFIFVTCLKSALDRERKPLQISSSKAERFEHSEVGQSFKPVTERI